MCHPVFCVDESFGIAIFSLIVFLFSTVCHEAAHAVVALRLGDKTAYHNGQVTLNPWPHIRQEPFGLGLLPLISMMINLQSGMPGVIGFASAPFDPLWAMRNPRRAAWMAMAGPAANFALALIAAVSVRAGIAAGLFQMAGGWQLASGTSEVADGFALFLSVLFFENLLLGAWNMLPIPPMDGFSMLLFFLPENRTTWFFEIRQQVGMMFPILMFGISSYFWQLFTPIFLTVRGWVF